MLELAFSDVDRMFEQSDIGMIRTIESLLLDASNRKSVQISDDINTIFKNLNPESVTAHAQKCH